MRKKRRTAGILLILLAVIIMQLPTESVGAAASTDFVMEGMSLASYRGSDSVVTVPDSVEVIGGSAFENNQKLEKVILPNTLKRIEAYAFWGCDSLKDIGFGKGIKEVSDYAFTSCRGLKELTLPGNITSIGIQAFADCVNLTDITIPSSVNYIHETAFDGCSRLVIHCQEGSYASKYAKDFYRRQQEFPEYEDVPGFVPSPDENLENFPVIPDEELQEDEGNVLGSVSIVGNQAVFLINNKKPTVYQGVIEKEEAVPQQSLLPVKYRMVDEAVIADQAWYKDAELKSIVLPEGIREVGEFSFARCAAKEVILPEGLEMISYGAFYHCDSLGRVSLPDTVRKVAPKAFEHSAWVEQFLQGADAGAGDFLISGGVLVAYRGEKKEIQIPEGVRVIAAGCFQGNTQLERVIFPESLVSVGEDAFADCSSLNEIQFQKGITEILDRAFAGCPLTEINLPSTLESLGLGAFDSETGLNLSGKTPYVTCEESAHRLSNDSYRSPLISEGKTEQAGQVLVLGMTGAGAKLQGADRAYTLTITEQNTVEEVDRAQRALHRNLGMELPEGSRLYSLIFTDESGIFIQKLGKQELTVTMPLPAEQYGKELAVFMYDRNGQLDRLEAEYIRRGSEQFLRFQTTGVYDIISVPTGQMLQEKDILEEADPVEQETVKTEQLSAAQGQLGDAGTVTTAMILKWSMGGLLLLAGLFFALTRVR